MSGLQQHLQLLNLKPDSVSYLNEYKVSFILQINNLKQTRRIKTLFFVQDRFSPNKTTDNMCFLTNPIEGHLSIQQYHAHVK